MASAVTFSALTYSGATNADDVLAAKYAITLENRARARQIPPGTPLPFDTPANIKASYLSILLASVVIQHDQNIIQSKTDAGLQLAFTSDQIEQIKGNLLTRLNNGESAASIIADTATL